MEHPDGSGQALRRSHGFKQIHVLAMMEHLRCSHGFRQIYVLVMLEHLWCSASFNGYFTIINGTAPRF